MCRAVGGKSRMTRDARSLESIAPRHHGWTRVADAPITASSRGCAFRPVTGSGILFSPSHGSRRPCWDLLHVTPPACFLSGGLIARTYFVWKFFSSGVFHRCVIGFLRNISRAIFQIASNSIFIGVSGWVYTVWIGYREILVPRRPTIRTVVRTRGRRLH